MVKDVLKEHQGQGTDYETPRNVLSSESKSKFTSVLPSRDKRLRHSANVLKVREEWRGSSNADIDALLRQLLYQLSVRKFGAQSPSLLAKLAGGLVPQQ